MNKWDDRHIEWDEIRELSLMIPGGINIFYSNEKVKDIMKVLEKNEMTLDGEPYITWDRFHSMSENTRRFYHDKLCDLVELI